MSPRRTPTPFEFKANMRVHSRDTAGKTGKFCFLAVSRIYPMAGKAGSRPRIFNQSSYRHLNGRLLGLLRFIQRVPINLTFTNNPPTFYLTYPHGESGSDLIVHSFKWLYRNNKTILYEKNCHNTYIGVKLFENVGGS